jgi:hypothetical protein
MSRWGLWALLLALVLPAGDVLALACEAPGAAVMPCCAEGMADCGQAGMMADCCQVVPASPRRAALATPATLHDHTWDAWSLAPVPALLLALSVPTAPAAERRAERARPSHAPPFSTRTTVLRI